MQRQAAQVEHLKKSPNDKNPIHLASNELEPLREDLIPFLVTRTGQKLVDFCKWLIDVRSKRCEELLGLAP